MTPIIDPGDPNQSIAYRECERGEDCPNYREGFGHAHGRTEVERDDDLARQMDRMERQGRLRLHGADATPPLRNIRPDVPDVRA
jgi:hypothetical protein